MDTAFLLNEAARANFLQLMMQSFGCTYVCIWSYWPQPSNCFLFLDGFYHEEVNTQPSASSRSLARKLFHEYRQLAFNVEEGAIPGLAFKHNVSCLELKESELQTFASAEVQSQFYIAARIKTSLFLGSTNGEIELGFSNPSQGIIEMVMKNLVPGEFTSRQLLHPTDQNLHSLSPSSVKSLSIGIPERSPLALCIPRTSHVQGAVTFRDIATPQQIPPNQQPIQAFRRTHDMQLPDPESEEAAITRAIIAVLSTPSSSSYSSHQPPLNVPHTPYSVNLKASAFKKYGSAPASSATHLRGGLMRKSMMKRSITFFRRLNLMRIRDGMQGSSGRPSSYQLQHMIKERKRREKLNDSFHTLRSLLPAGTKRDRASVLTSAREYLTSLKVKVDELNRTNQKLLLMASQPLHLPHKNQETHKEEEDNTYISNSNISSNERFSIRVSHLPESTSQGLIRDLQIDFRSEEVSIMDLVISILEFLKSFQNVSLVSMESNTHVTGSVSFIRLIIRLNIDQDGEWDEAAFMEAIRRVVAGMAP